MRRGPSIRYLVLFANAFVLLLPVFAIWFLRLWDGHLVRITEQQLMAESVLLGESYVDELRRVEGRPPAAAAPAPIGIEPVLPLSYQLEPPAPDPARAASERSAPAWPAGAAVEPAMRRAGRRNLSAARLLDAEGCVVASTGGDVGACVDNLPEVQRALAGRYDAVARERRLDGPPPRLGSLSRRGEVRVFTAMPVRDDGRVVGAVLMSRTSSSPLEVVWDLRYTVLAALLLCLAVTAAVSLFLSRRIAQPVQAITAAAAAVTRGEPARTLTPSGFVPAEVATLSTTLERMAEQLTARAAYIAQFAANASHELKTPITGIRGAVELLQESWETMTPAQRQKFLANVAADATRMERLVSRLLELARIENAPDRAEAIAVREFFPAQLARYGEPVRLHVAADAPAEVLMAPQQLEAALHNLVDNALRHGAGRPVDVDVGAAAGRLRVRVRDHGSGISPGNRTRIFDRFFTTERDRGGTGLGLAIVRAVADLRGGSIDCDTGQGGTTFTLIV